MANSKCEACDGADRRGFVKKLASYVIGGVITVLPFAAGLAVWLDPVRRKSQSGGRLVRVANLNGLPEDGIPRKFAIVASRVDGWNHWSRLLE